MASMHSGNIINAVSMDASITSSVLDIHNTTIHSIHFISASDTHVGAITIQGSNDGVNWHDLTADVDPALNAVTSGAAYNEIVIVADIAIHYLRCIYTRTSGTGTLTAIAYLS